MTGDKISEPFNSATVTIEMSDGTRMRFKISDVELSSLTTPRKVVMTLHGGVQWLKKGER